MIHALETANTSQKKELYELMSGNSPDKVSRVLDIFRSCGIDEWARELKVLYADKAMKHLEAIAVVSSRKTELQKLADFLLNREH
jgi:geranylgeranyl diphosphate synthase type II